MDAWNPAQYEKFKNERSQPIFDLISMIEPIPGGRAVDLGCGTGEWTPQLHRAVGARETIGIDSSMEMLKKASQYREAGVEFAQGDINAWNPQAEFDLIFSNAALQWCHGHEQLFVRLRQALRSGGQFGIQMPMNHDHPSHAIAQEMAQESPWRERLGDVRVENQRATLEPEVYAEMLFDLGFQAQKVLLRVYPHVLNSREDVVEWVKGTTLNRFKTALPPGEYAEFLDAYRIRLFAVLEDDRPFFYSFKRVFLWGKL